MNERDTEIMAQSLASYGYIEDMDIDTADLVILNTCSIRAKAEQKVMSLLGYLRKNKASNSDLKICVAGCVAQQEGQRIIDRMPHVDLVIGTQNIYDIGRLLEESSQRGHIVKTHLDDYYEIPQFLPEVNKATGAQSALPLPSAPVVSFRKFVTIMQGCNNYCTYCVVPYTRGREVSRKSKDIIDEVNVLVEAGVKEITLLGQNVNSYGRTNSVSDHTNDYTFSDLITAVSEIDGLERLRFTTSNPKDLTGDLIQRFGNTKKLCPQFHLPVQSGSDAVLKRMNRKYTIEHYLEKVDKLREVCPEIAITTDIIVGFPGETENDFELTMDLLEKVRFHGSFSFKYSDRPGTAANKMDGKVDEETKSQRLSRFQQRQDAISLERNCEYVGQEKEVMVEEVGENGAKGRTTTNHIVHFKASLSCSPGEIIRAKIVHAGQHSLQGEQIR